MKTGRSTVFIVILISLLAALPLLAWRWSVEQNNRVVSMAVDWSSITEAVGGDVDRLDDALDMMRRRNLRTIALSEVTVGELLDDGRAFMLMPEPAHYAVGLSGHMLRVGTYDAALQRQMAAALKRKWSPEIATGREGSILFVDLPGPLESVASIGIGILSGERDYLLGRGFEIVPRLYNYPTLDLLDLRSDLQGIERYKFNVAIFGGDEVLGNKRLLPEVASVLSQKGLRFGQIEFSRQEGEARLAELMRGKVIRVHSITPEELKTMSPQRAVDRYVRAVTERNIRLCYVRFLPPEAGEDPLQANLGEGGYLVRIKEGLQAAGYEIGRPANLPPVLGGALRTTSPAFWLLFLIGPGVITAGWALVCRLGRCLNLPLLLLAAMPLQLLLLQLDPDLYRKLFALAAAMIFPALAVAYMNDRLGAEDAGGGAGRAAGSLLRASGITLVGALLAAALLSERNFMLGIDRFAGVKAAHLLPLLLAVWFVFRGRLPQDDAAPGRPWTALWRRPLLWGETALLGLALVAGAVYLLRTGNESQGAVSSLELQFRSLLERLLVARPRTKEFLIGHPSSLLALASAAGAPLYRFRPWLLLVGAIGQVSLFNSFCHIHTPLAFTFLRSFNALWLGMLLGFVLLFVSGRVIKPVRAKA